MTGQDQVDKTEKTEFEDNEGAVLFCPTCCSVEDAENWDTTKSNVATAARASRWNWNAPRSRNTLSTDRPRHVHEANDNRTGPGTLSEA